MTSLGPSAQFFADALSACTGPLDGVSVLDLTHAWAGPMATCLLADLGADVCRVELPGARDGRIPPRIPGTTSSWFREAVNRNKRATSIDVRSEPGRSAFLDLAATADIVVENFRPGRIASWGIGYDDLSRRNPGVIVVSISGWGQYGPLADAAGYDTVTQAVTGWMALNGEPAGGPQRAPTYLADDLAGLHAAIGALAALRHRDQTGEGQHVDVSLYDCLLFQSNGHAMLAAAGHDQERRGNEIEGIVPSNLYRCADGEIYLVIALDRHWRVLAAALGHPELARAEGFATNRERLRNQVAVDGLIDAWCRERSALDVEATLRAAGLAVGAVRTYAEAVAHPHTAARAMVQETELADGTMAPLTGPAVKFSRTPTSVRHAAPPAR